MKFAAKMGVWLLNLAAVGLVVYSVGLVFTSNFNMGNLMVWLCSALVAVYAIWRQPINAWFSTGVGRVFWWLGMIALAVYALLIDFVAVSGYFNPPTGNEQVIIVLGAGLRGDKPSNVLRARLDKAYEYAAAHPETVIVTTGGQGRDEWVPEGQAMRDYLVEKGIDPARIFAETKSTSTEENFAFALQILEQQGYTGATPIVYVSNAFHCYRAGQYAGMAGFTTTAALPAATPLRSVLPCYLREALALLYYWVFKTSTSGPMHALVGFLDINKQIFYK